MFAQILSETAEDPSIWFLQTGTEYAFNTCADENGKLCLGMEILLLNTTF